MDPVTMGIMAGGGLLTGLLGQSAQERQAKAQMMARAAEQEAQPWTGQAAQTQVSFAPQTAVGAGLGGALSGFQTAQSMGQASQQADINKAMLDRLRSGGQVGALESMGLGSAAQTLYGNNMGMRA